jgi:transcription antitermination factor NusG
MNCYPWYAVQTKARHETAVARYLRSQGLEEYLPLHRVQRQWSDRVKTVDLPLLSGYLFCRVDPRQLKSVLRAPGVVHVLGYGSEPVPVPESEVLAIWRLQESRLVAWPCPYLRAGMAVRIRSGALAGVVGRLERIKNQCRLVLSVHLLQRSVALEVDPEIVEAL